MSDTLIFRTTPMLPRIRTIFGALALCAVATACADNSGSPTDPTVSLKGGVSGGGGGGGGTTAPKPGQIQPVSVAATCDKGSSYSVSIRKGFADRAELTILAFASATPTGPAIPPSTLQGTSIGGYTTMTMVNDATGALMYGQAGGFGYSVPSYRIVTLTSTLPVGTTPVRFTWTNQQLDGITFQPDLTTIPVYETCSAVVNVFAK
jgi:hypothetical protein